MANEITNYQCPACTGPLHFGSESGVLECDYCGSRFSVEDIDRMYAEKNANAQEATEQREAKESIREGQWDMDAAGESWGEEGDSLRAYNCPSCGAELVCDETTAATACPYCGNPSIIPGKLSGSKKPDLIIPFKVDKNAAVAALKKHYNHKPLLPKAFKAENHVQEIKGVYVPFWLFDAQVEGDMTFKTTRVHTRTTPKEYITETDHFLVHREGTLDFENVPVDGSSQMPDAHMDAIEPYDYRAFQPFSTAFLPGYMADKYDEDADTCQARAHSRMQNSVSSELSASITGYNSVSTLSESIHIDYTAKHYALLPVWMLHTKWQGKDYLFAMNGQTGKLVGDLPVDKRKVAAWFAGISVPLMILLAILL